MSFLNDLVEEVQLIVEENFNCDFSFDEIIEFPWQISNYLDKIRQYALENNLFGILKSENVNLGSYVVIDSEAIILCGKNVTINPFTQLRGLVILGDNSVVGGEIKNSIILKDSKKSHHGYLGDSIIGRRCNIGAGSTFANLRFDQKSPRIKYKNQVYEQPNRKIGAIVEHDCKFGINSSIAPGTYVESGKMWIDKGVLRKK